MAGFTVAPGAVGSRVILHVPHSSREIPAGVRDQLMLDDRALAEELDRMTDAHTDVIARRAAAGAAVTPWRFVNGLSRLVVDPERFADEAEPMAAVGMGRVYTRTSSGEPLRAPAPELVERFFEPYARGFADLVRDRLAAVGRVTIVDVHSYPSTRLPYETGGPRRPPVCLGTDPFHTPQWIIAAAREAFGTTGSLATAENTPFAGCYVPLAHYGTDGRVTGIMVELRRDGYLVEPGGPPTEGLATVATALTALIDALDAG